MTRNLLRAGALSCALLTSTAMCTQPLLAQTGPVPVRETIDPRGVDLFRGTFAGEIANFSLGIADAALAYTTVVRGAITTDNVTTNLYTQGSTFIATMAGVTDRFTQSGSSFTNIEGTGATLAYDSGSQEYAYTARDGTVVTFKKNPSDLIGAYLGWWEARGTSIVQPDGERLDLVWQQVPMCESYEGDRCTGGFGKVLRLASATNAFGYRLSFTYYSDDQADGHLLWGRVADVKGVNLAVESCSASAAPCTTTGNWPSISTITPLTAFSRTSGQVTGVSLGGTTQATFAYSTSLGGSRISSVTDALGAWGYAYADNTGTNERTVTVTNPLSQATTYVFDLTSERLKNVTDALSRTTSFLYDSDGRTTRITRPEGNYTSLTYDARGNVTESRQVAKSGTGLADIVTSAAFASSCSNPVTCNQPTSTTDARGAVTDYTYNSTHGGVLSVTGPAPSGSGDRPEVRYSYTSLTSASGTSVTRLTGTSQCLTGSSCTSGANERVAALSYTSGNLLPAGMTVSAGDNSISSATAMSYDDIGNLLTVDGPLSGTVDTTRHRYDVHRRRIGTVGPDPDGSGSLVHRAERVTYTGAFVAKVEAGTTAGQSDSDWAAFSPAQRVDLTNDANGRPLRQAVMSGSTTYAVADQSYDAAGRPTCSTTRMNLGALPTAGSDACTAGSAGSYGPDRITRTTHDAAGQPTLVQTAHGVTGVQADEVIATYRANGQVETLEDGEGNLSTYVYDGHDRLSRTRFPDTTQGAGTSSTTDYQELTYDAGSNVTNVRLRDATNIALSYDNLNRITAKDLPGSEPTVAYSYDLTGNLTGAGDGTQSLSYTYDALGRQLSQADSVNGTTSASYDVAGRRATLTYPLISAVISYDYLVTGELSAIRGGSTTVFGFGYDSLGRRTGLTRINGVGTSYGYDPVGRLSSLSHDLTGSGDDVTFGYAYNPAGQIVGRTTSNDAYAFTGLANGSVTDTHNGLNQLTDQGTVSRSYNERGNTDAIGSASYGYTAENRLVSGPSGSFAHDPLGRLMRSSSTSTDFVRGMDGQLLVERATGGSVTGYAVAGPGVNEQLYEHRVAGATDRYLLADERGSIIAIADGSGALTAINRYDDYGQPQGGSINGRFGYTGQAWLPEAGMYDYHARVYDPLGGRFMQTDPIGYGDGMNTYAYVGGDPVNRIDPSGLGRTGNACPIDSVPDGNGGCRGIGPEMVSTHWRNSGWRSYAAVTISWDGLAGGGGGGFAKQSRDTWPPETGYYADVTGGTACPSEVAGAGGFLQSYSSYVSDVGAGTMLVGAGITGYGVLSGNVPAAAAGIITFTAGLAATAIAGTMSLIGSALEALGGGSPGPLATSLVNDAIVSRIPAGEFGQYLAGEVLGGYTDQALNAVEGGSICP